MEIHRLTPMKENYPVDLFNKLYSQTHYLRRKLSSQIDPRRYGVSRDIIDSWFDDKFMFVFNKHFDNKNPDVLKGFLINSLQTYKYRILRKAYGKESEYYQSIVDIEGESNLINIIPDVSEISSENLFHDLAFAFMKDKLSEDAYLIFEIQINPPPYIINRLNKSNSYIPNDLLTHFLNLKSSNKTKKYISKLRKEIKITTEIAKEYFLNNPLAISYSNN